MSIRVLKDSTDPIKVYPIRQHLGVPTAATFRVSTVGSALPDTGVAATIDPVAASTSAEGQRGATSLTFASDPLATPGNRYLLLLPDGKRFQVEVMASGMTTELADPLPTTIPAGTSFAGIAMSLALTTTQTEALGRGLVKVSATIDGADRRWDQQFRVVREEFALLLSVPELLKMHPDILRLKDPSDETLGEAIDSAWEFELLGELEARTIYVDRINSPDKLNRALGACVRWRRIAAQRGDDAAQTIAAKERYDEVLRSTLDGIDFWYDPQETDADPGDGPQAKRRDQYARYSR